MILIKNGQLYAPEFLGVSDILIGGNQILYIDKSISASALPGEVEVLDATGLVVTPGFIDGHQHFTGGGGEGGFHTRTPEMSVSVNLDNGVTTAVGLLGTDARTRSVEALYAKTMALSNEGMTTFMLTGSYWLPSPTITGSVAKDICFVHPVIGLKMALADNRGPVVSAKQLATVAADVRNSALISGKPGIITVHMGAEEERMALIFEAADSFNTNPNIFLPTHINRKDPGLESQAFRMAEMGATVDASCMDHVPDDGDKNQAAATFYAKALDAGLGKQVTFSSDAGGSLPRWDVERKNIIGMGVGTPDSLCFELNQLVNSMSVPLETALRPLTTSPAKLYGLGMRKGALKSGYDADVLLLHPDTMQVSGVVARGRIVKKEDTLIAKGYFEE